VRLRRTGLPGLPGCDASPYKVVVRVVYDTLVGHIKKIEREFRRGDASDEANRGAERGGRVRLRPNRGFPCCPRLRR
jgi:hypothetical protein